MSLFFVFCVYTIIVFAIGIGAGYWISYRHHKK
jgi:hypothetical protein